MTGTRAAKSSGDCIAICRLQLPQAPSVQGGNLYKAMPVEVNRQTLHRCVRELMWLGMCVQSCVRSCIVASVRACVRVLVHLRVHASVRGCVHNNVGTWEIQEQVLNTAMPHSRQLNIDPAASTRGKSGRVAGTASPGTLSPLVSNTPPPSPPLVAGGSSARSCSPTT